MEKVKRTGILSKFHKNEKGQGMVEYALILALIAIVVIAALTPLGTKVKSAFDDIAAKFTSGGTPGPAPSPAPS